MKKHWRKILIGSALFLVIYSVLHGFRTLKQAGETGGNECSDML